MKTKISNGFNLGYLECLNDLEEFINQVSEFDKPPTMDEIKNHFIKLQKQEHNNNYAINNQSLTIKTKQL